MQLGKKMSNNNNIGSTLYDKQLLEHTTTKPIKWCGAIPRYKYNSLYNETDMNIQSMELFYNFRYFVRNATGWGQSNARDYVNMADYYITWRQLVAKIGIIAREKGNDVILVSELIPKRISSATNIYGKKKNNIILDNMKDLNVYHLLKKEQTVKEFVGIRLRLTVIFKQNIDDSIVDTESNDNNNNNANRPPVQARPLNSLGDYVDMIIRENHKNKNKIRPRNAPPRLALEYLTMAKWRKMCAVLTGHRFKLDDTSTGCTHEDSVYNPINAFAPLLSTIAAWTAGAVAECSDPDNYENFQFPFDNEHVYRLTLDTFEPEEQHYCFFPHIPHPDHVINYEEDEYLTPFNNNMKFEELPKGIKVGLTKFRQSRGSKQDLLRILSLENREYDTENEAGEGMGDEKHCDPRSRIPGAHLLPNLEDAKNTYAQLVNQKQRENIPDYTIQEFGKKTRQMYQTEVESKHKKIIINPYWKAAIECLERDNANQPDILNKKKTKIAFQKHIINPGFIDARHKFIISRYIDFEKEIWHEDAAIPDSVKAICLWEKQYLATHRNFSMPQPKSSSNLSTFGDFMTSKLAIFDAAEEVFTVHTQTLTCILSSLQVFFDTIFHAHILFAGPPRAGKSFTQKKAMDALIEGTFRKLTYETMKAKTGAGSESPYKYSQLVEFFEEILPSTLGISNNNNAKGSTNNSDAEALFKNLLTSGEITFSTVVTDGNGKRHLVQQTVKVNNVIIAATNAYFSSIPDAMVSRFITITYQNNERADRGGAAAKVSGKIGTARDYAKKLSQLRWHRDQYLMCKTAYFLQGMNGIIQLDLSCADAVFAIIADSASKEPYCLKGFNDVRKIEQLRFITTPSVCLHAFHKVYDSDTSNIKELDYHPIHFLQILPYLKATTEHAVFALGLLEHQFEDQIYENVISTLINNVFKTNPATTMSQDNSNTGNLIIDFEQKEQKQQGLKPWHSGTVNEEGPYLYVAFGDIGLTHRQTKQDKNGNITIVDSNNTQGTPVDHLIRKLAHYIETKMIPTPQIGDIVRAIQDLKEKTVPKKIDDIIYGDRGGHTIETKIRNIPILEFDMQYNRLKIVKTYVEENISTGNNKNKLKTCIEKTLSHKYARECELIYGAAHESYPNIFGTVKIKPNPRAKPLSVINPDYFDETIKRLTIEALEGVLANNKDQSKSMEIDWNEMFADKQCLTIDSDLDDYFTFQFLHQSYYTEEECKLDPDNLLPFNHPINMKKYAIAKYNDNHPNKLLISYPECYQPLAHAVRNKKRSQQQQQQQPDEHIINTESMAAKINEFKRRMKSKHSRNGINRYDDVPLLIPETIIEHTEQKQQQQQQSMQTIPINPFVVQQEQVEQDDDDNPFAETDRVIQEQQIRPQATGDDDDNPFADTDRIIQEQQAPLSPSNESETASVNNRFDFFNLNDNMTDHNNNEQYENDSDLVSVC